MQDLLLIVFFLIMLGVIISVVLSSLVNGISPMPTSNKAKAKILANLPKAVNGNILELGSGWGTLVIPLAIHYPDLKVIGYETSFVPYVVSVIRAKSYGLKNLKIEYLNFYKADLKEAGLLLCYLYPGAMQKLKSKFEEEELKSGTWIISNTFAVPGWKPHTTIELDDIYRTKIYIYRKT